MIITSFNTKYLIYGVKILNKLLKLSKNIFVIAPKLKLLLTCILYKLIKLNSRNKYIKKFIKLIITFEIIFEKGLIKKFNTFKKKKIILK